MGTWAATALVVSEVVGVGILLTPATMMRSLGGIWAPLAMWVATGAMSAAGALCYAELATRFPRAGGTYVFLREGFGRRCAFVYGWMAMLVMDPGITAALGIGAAQYLLATVGVSTRFTTVVALAAIVACALLVTRGLSVGARVMAWTGAVKLAIVGVLVLAGLWRFIGGAPAAVPLAAAAAGPEALAASVIAAFFAFGGWWDLGRMSEEVASPRRTMPKALIGGVLLVAAIYIVVTATFVMAAPGLTRKPTTHT
jgi:APA family basic amino acid/polyamine antiporter